MSEMKTHHLDSHLLSQRKIKAFLNLVCPSWGFCHAYQINLIHWSFNSFAPSDAIWRHGTWSTLHQVMLGAKLLIEPMLTYCNGFAPNRWQDIAWTNDYLVRWPYMASPGHCELLQKINHLSVSFSFAQMHRYASHINKKEVFLIIDEICTLANFSLTTKEIKP